MKSLASQALADAAVAHQNQHRWRNGEPYFAHAFRVYSLVKHAAPRVAVQAAAAMHDVLEDQPLYDFQGAGVGEKGLRAKYGAEVLRLVKALTHRDDRRLTDSEYVAYIERVQREPDAVIIKVADLIDNLHGLNETHDNYWRYKDALGVLDPDGRIQRAMGVSGVAVRRSAANMATVRKHLAAHSNGSAAPADDSLGSSSPGASRAATGHLLRNDRGMG